MQKILNWLLSFFTIETPDLSDVCQNIPDFCSAMWYSEEGALGSGLRWYKCPLGWFREMEVQQKRRQLRIKKMKEEGLLNLETIKEDNIPF